MTDLTPTPAATRGAFSLCGKFFDAVRPMFGGRLAQAQVNGMAAIAGAWSAWLPENADISPNPRWLAYLLATAFHETAATMRPIAEIGGGAGKIYGRPDPVSKQVYFGRGLIQLTWRANYEVQGKRLGLDLVNQPDLALRPDVAADIALHGMAHGQFTGRRLGQYFGTDPKLDRAVGARAIINGSDRASLVASYHARFLAALRAGGAA